MINPVAIVSPSHMWIHAGQEVAKVDKNCVQQVEYGSMSD